jgi:hypothetical protein
MINKFISKINIRTIEILELIIRLIKMMIRSNRNKIKMFLIILKILIKKKIFSIMIFQLIRMIVIYLTLKKKIMI